jgi:RNA polymerase sigma-70 factor, ECF subfamily
VEPLLRIVPWPRVSADPADDLRLVEGLRAREPWATGALIERYGEHVRRVLMRLLGGDHSEHNDLFQEVITEAWRGVGRLENASALKAWVTRIAVFTARGALRRQRRRRWLLFVEELPETPMAWAGPELEDAARAVYGILARMPLDERIPFTLRVLEDMDLEATAAASGMSVATVRRRLASAEKRFRKLAAGCEALEPWTKERSR